MSEQAHAGDSAGSTMGANAPIGIFDSGIGGLSVLRHIQACLQHEHLLYFADSGYAPYGDKMESAIVARSLGIAGFLRQQQVKAIVVACNTATAAAIHAIRETWPDLPVVGVEPGLKPAATLTRSGIAGVLATQRTVNSQRFQRLEQQITAATGVRFVAQACSGLADAVEKGELRSAATMMLLQRYIAPLIDQGADTLVLGCTHYPFVRPAIETVGARLAGKAIAIVDTGEPVARQLARLLNQRSLLSPSSAPGTLTVFTSGSQSAMTTALSRLLGLQPPVFALEATG